MIGIYKITNMINGKVYIGQSNNIEHRWIDHKSSAYNENSNTYNYILYKAMRKYGLDNFTFEKMEECEEDRLDELEVTYIEKYNSYVHAENSNGYNMTLGGGGIRGHKHTQEAKEKISIANGGENHPLYGVIPSQETRDKISKANSNPSDETRRKMSEAKKGRKVPEEQIRRALETKLAKGQIGNRPPKEKATPEQLEFNRKKASEKMTGSGNPAAIKVICEGEIYGCVKDCANHYGINADSIRMWLRGDRAMPKKFIDLGLNYADESMRIESLKEQKEYGGRARRIILLNTLEVFDMILQAKEKYNAFNIAQCCKGKTKSAGKHPETGEPLRWMYYDKYIELNYESEVV